VVLIDEIDKAPRDLPNDLLNEIEGMEFTVRETGQRFAATDGYRPIVILTSNSEKNLPDAFLRRCVFYHIDFSNT
jgi:MoxR-like ATPase